MINETTSTSFSCAYYGEINHTFVDPFQGKTQKYIEDCSRGNRDFQPNELNISYDEWNLVLSVGWQTQPSDGFSSKFC